jgi:hypothetical protein
MFIAVQRVRVLSVAFVLILCQIASSQTITSKTGGGRWNDPATWTGGVVPAATNDVVIAGPVNYRTGDGACKNLTVNAGGSLFNYSDYYTWTEQYLSVSGTIANNGTLYNADNRNLGLVLRCAGDVTNNGTWTCKRLELVGTGTKTLRQGASNRFDSALLVDTTAKPAVVAGSNLSFSTTVDLSKSTLDMKSFTLTLYSNAGNVTNGSVVNAKDIIGVPTKDQYTAFYPIVNNITYDGAPTIKGRILINTNVTLKGVITVVDTIEELTGYYEGEKTLWIKGDLINNGIVRTNGSQSRGLVLNATGNITNNGKWTFKRIDLSGTGDQSIALGTGKLFESAFMSTDSLGLIVAGSNLSFTSGFDLGRSRLDMKSLSVTLSGNAANIYNGSVINAKDIIGVPTRDQYSAYYPILDNITYDGNPTIKGRILINTSVTLRGVVTVTDTVEEKAGYYDYEKTLWVKGSLINNGIIRTAGTHGGLILNVTGNITSSGKWVHSRTDLSGTSDQSLVLAPSKLFEAAFRVTDSLGMIVAGSHIGATSGFDLHKCVLDMKNYALTLQGSGATIYNGIVINVSDIIGVATHDTYYAYYPILDNVTYDGKPNIKGRVQINSNVTLRGLVSVSDTVEEKTGYYDYEKTLWIIGSFTNNGIVRTIGSRGLTLDVTGDVTANKRLTNNRVQLAGIGNRTVVDKLSQTTYLSTGERVVLYGDSYLPNLFIDSKSKCMLANSSNILTSNGNIDPALDNWSCITITKKFTGAQTYPFFRSSIKVLANTAIDSVRIQSYGHQLPSTFAGAVRAWWRVKTFASNTTQSFTSMTFQYDHDLLGSNTESLLQVFQSVDSGMTWRQVSTTANTARDVNAHTVTLTDAFGFGDYILSSTADPSSVRPSIITAVIGSPQVRIGAPSRYTVQFVNNSDIVAEDFLLAVNTGGKVHIQRAEIPLASGGKLVLPKDSLFYENEDTTAVFYVLKMAPREERLFDIIVMGDEPSQSAPRLNKALFIDPVSLTAAAVVTWAAWKAGTYVVCKGIDYVGDKLSDGLKLSPADQKRYDDAVKGGIPNELEQHPNKVKVFALKTVGGMALKKTLDLAPGGSSAVQIAGTITQNVKKVAPSLRQRIFNWFNKETGLYGVEQTESGNAYQPSVTSTTQKKGQLVRSCDPNQKVGPQGFGDNNFITTAARMKYQILFENKKEATAPAYRIVIVDTLRPEFDPATFEFGRTSHDGPQYNWVKTRKGNIVSWGIEGIELPPNMNPPEGEGWVEFSVMPVSGAASGTVLKNGATIQFDMNPLLATNVFTNALDFSPPATVMRPLPQKSSSRTLTVKWQSSDGGAGSGVESVALYASKDGGPYALVGEAAADSLVVPVDAGSHRYSFYALAKDNVGNVESARPAPVVSDVVNGVEENAALPMEFSLSQNYPNPFNPATEIAFSLSLKVRATLRIYDMLGREIETLMDEEKNPGRYSVRWNAGRCASGVYFYRLIAGDFVQTRKLMLMK